MSCVSHEANFVLQDFFKLHESEKEKQHDIMDELDSKAQPDDGHAQNTARSQHTKDAQDEKKKQADRYGHNLVHFLCLNIGFKKLLAICF